MGCNVRGLAIVLAILLGASAASAANLYRYRDDSGVLVVNWQVPPKYIDGGYEVLNESGMVLKVVPPTPKEAEQADESTTAADQFKAEEERERLRAWSESLLRRYSSIADIEAAQDRTLKELRVRISILQSNRRSLRQRVEGIQARVAEAERMGGNPSDVDLEAIEALQAEIAATDRAIADRQQQIDQASAGYQRDIERFKELQDIVRLRRNLERSGS